jgi:hypothetical protein
MKLEAAKVKEKYAQEEAALASCDTSKSDLGSETRKLFGEHTVAFVSV